MSIIRFSKKNEEKIASKAKQKQAQSCILLQNGIVT